MALQSASLFDEIGAAVAADPGLVKKVRARALRAPCPAHSSRLCGHHLHPHNDSSLSLSCQVKGVIQFIVQPGGAWVVDLKNGNGSVKEGKAAKADMTLTVKDADLVAIASGKLNPQQVRAEARARGPIRGRVALTCSRAVCVWFPTQAFMRGKLKVKGNMGLAMKLGTVIKAAQANKKASPAASAPKAAAPAKSSLQSAVLFDEIAAAIASDGANLVKKVCCQLVMPGFAWAGVKPGTLPFAHVPLSFSMHEHRSRE